MLKNMKDLAIRYVIQDRIKHTEVKKVDIELLYQVKLCA
jgi:hypothetical protein